MAQCTQPHALYLIVASSLYSVYLLRWGNPVKCFSQQHNKWTYHTVAFVSEGQAGKLWLPFLKIDLTRLGIKPQAYLFRGRHSIHLAICDYGTHVRLLDGSWTLMNILYIFCLGQRYSNWNRWRFCFITWLLRHLTSCTRQPTLRFRSRYYVWHEKGCSSTTTETVRWS